jgi:hypothetical protein
MAVDSFDPSRRVAKITPTVTRTLTEAAERLDEAWFGLDETRITDMAGIARHGPVDWAEAARELTDVELIALVRVFTRGERDFAAWEAGARSPVIPIVRELKRRRAFPAELTAWIRANSDNRFLPHGDLMDRL